MCGDTVRMVWEGERVGSGMREWYDSGECAARKWRMCGEKVGSVK